MTGNYRLANKLKREFRERGSEVNGMSATTTSELMRRAEMGRDPRINCAEEAFRENYGAERRSAANAGRPEPQTVRRTMGSQPREAHRGTASYASADERISPSGIAAGSMSANGTAANGRTAPESGGSRPQNRPGYTGTERERQTARSARFAGEERTAVPPQSRSIRSVRAQAEEETQVQQVRKKAIPPLLLAYLIVATILFLSFIFSITEVYKASSQLAQLQNQLEQLEATEQDMELQLEEKNDIREIEAIATGRLGMTKEDSLQRRFVSLSDGERIELAEAEEETAAGGVMLSSVFSALGRFLERFR